LAHFSFDFYMEFLTNCLMDYGYVGMFIAALLAGSAFPFSSEAVLVVFLRMGLDPVLTTAVATVGNVLGGLTCYGIGHLGKMQWIEHYLHVPQEKLERAHRFVEGKGAWMGFFTFLPILGSAIAIALGMMRANLPLTTLAMAAGKLFRYLLVIAAAEGLIRLIF
jgi:membrane protein YqaA with SNARE-associated domain